MAKRASSQTGQGTPGRSQSSSLSRRHEQANLSILCRIVLRHRRAGDSAQVVKILLEALQTAGEDSNFRLIVCHFRSQSAFALALVFAVVLALTLLVKVHEVRKS